MKVWERVSYCPLRLTTVDTFKNDDAYEVVKWFSSSPSLARNVSQLCGREARVVAIRSGSI